MDYCLGVDVSILYGTWYPPAIEGCIHLLGEAVSTKWYCMQVCILIVFELVSTNYWYESWYQPYIGVVHLLYWFLKCAANYVDFWYVAILLAYTIFLKIVICCPFFLPNYGHQNLPDATTGRPIIFWLQKCPNWSNFFGSISTKRCWNLASLWVYASVSFHTKDDLWFALPSFYSFLKHFIQYFFVVFFIHISEICINI